MSRQQASSTILVAVNETYEKLFSSDSVALQALPAEAEHKFRNTDVGVFVVQQAAADGALRIIVGAGRSVLGGLATAQLVRGFVLTANGDRRELLEHEMYEYI